MTRLSALILAALAAGCEGTTPESAERGTDTTARTTGMGPSAPGTPETSDAVTAADPTQTAGTAPAPGVGTGDAGIVATLVAENDAEIELARLAKAKSKDAGVLAFADRTIADHGAANEKVRTIAPGVGTQGVEQQQQAAATTERLKALEGAEFDRAYVDHVVKAHEAALETLDRKLIPAARSTALVTALAELRPTIDAHLAQAREMQQRMGGAAPATH